MEIHMSHCEKCMSRLSVMPPPVVSLYLKMCLCEVEVEGLVTFDGSDVKTARSIRLLERRGFILTTETGNESIDIKVKGHKIEVDGEAELHFFCAFQDKHLDFKDK